MIDIYTNLELCNANILAFLLLIYEITHDNYTLIKAVIVAIGVIVRIRRVFAN